MARLGLLLRLTFVLCLVAGALTVASFLALHDIAHDYVSIQVLQSQGVSLSRDLPLWTKTELEWAMVTVGLAFQGGFLVLTAITLRLGASAIRSQQLPQTS